MKITVKLYALLGRYLPRGAVGNVAAFEVERGATPLAVLGRLGVPAEHCHLVLVNGEFVPPGERAVRPLGEGDVLAVWPPVAGGRE